MPLVAVEVEADHKMAGEEEFVARRAAEELVEEEEGHIHRTEQGVVDPVEDSLMCMKGAAVA